MDYNNETLKEVFTKALEDKSEVTAQSVGEIAQSIQEEARRQLGAGIYVRAVLNTDMGGINFRWRRPSCHERWDYFIPCDRVMKPLDESSQNGEGSGSSEDDNTSKVEPNAGSEDRSQLFFALVDRLEEGDFTQDGRPNLSSLNALVEGDDEDFSSDERNLLWASRSQN